MIPKSTVVNAKGCWLWQGEIDDQGYPVIRSLRRKLRIHRLIYKIFHGDIPNDRNVVVMHTCDTKACINPEHYSLGSRSENTKDYHDKKRRSK